MSAHQFQPATFPWLSPSFPLGLFLLIGGTICSFICIIVSTVIIYRHRRHARRVAAEKGRKVVFKDSGSEISGLLECLFCLISIVIMVLIGLGIIPLELLLQQLNPSNIGLIIFLSVLLYVAIPIILIIATIWTIKIQRKVLQRALQAKPRAKRKPIAKIRCPNCDKIIPRNWQYCDSCGASTTD